MVKKFLKIAGVKTEADFYKKYPSESAFFKAHPEAKDLKQYKQGGQMKKLNQLTNWTNDVDGIIPTAQRGAKCKSGYGCHGDSKTPTGDGIKKPGVRYQPEPQGNGENYTLPSNAPVTWAELLTYTATNPKDKAFKNQFKTLQGQFPGLTQDQMLAAGADSARIQQRMTNLPRYDQPSEQTFDKAYHQFYRPLMDQKTPVTIPQILQYQSQQPGGLQGFEGTVRGNYNRPKAQNGAPIGSYMSSPMQQTKMMNFSDYMNPMDKMVTGSTQEERDAAAKKQAEDAAKQKSGGGGLGSILGMASQFIGKGGGGSNMGAIGASALGGVGKGKNGIRKAQGGGQQTYGVPANVQNPYGQQTYVPGQGGTGLQQYNPTYTGLPTASNYNPQGTFNLGSSGQQPLQNNFLSQGYTGVGSTTNDKKPFNPLKGIPIAGQIVGGIQQIKEAKNQEKEANKQFQLSGLTKQAALTRGEPIKRKYVRPEDQAINENEMFPTYGVGTNYIAEDGAEVTRGGIGGNPTEIQNLYNPYNLFEDLGYEPLEDSEKIKQYQGGGLVGAGQFSQLGQGLGAMVGGNGNGSPAGWSQALGAIPGPIGMIGGIVGSVIDGRQQAKIRNFQEKAQKNVVDTAMQQGMQNIQGQYSNVMQDGGYLSHDWQPQVIASFGGHRVSDLLHRDPMMDTLRTGGHITQNQNEDMGPITSMAMGGELKTHWGGYAEPMSYNPYLPEGGETVMFKGQSHDETDGQGNTGIGVTYGESPVEVERNEPAIKMKDGSTGEDNMVVYGNLKIPNQYVSEIGDPKAKGRKFKHYVSDLSKQEEKLNKVIEKNLRFIDDTDDVTSFDQMKFFSAKANIDGANMKLKQIAGYKMNAASVQNAINDSAAEHGLDADALARGKFKLDKKAMDEAAKWGKSIKKAQNGSYSQISGEGFIDYNKIGEAGNDELWGSEDSYEKKWKPKVDEALSDPKRADEIIKSIEGYTGQDAKDVIATIKKQKTRAGKIAKIQELGTDSKVGPYHNILNQAIDTTAPPVQTTTPTTTLPIVPTIPTTTTPTTTHYPITERKGEELPNYLNQALQYIRPYTREDLDPTQMYGEMYALATNQLDPVQAQLYHPLLEQPYDISLQDQLNANQADFNAMQRQVGYNPAAASQLAGQKYAANSKVLADQFRLNQEEKAGVYNRNRGTLNQAQLQNLGILDQQMVRQETAKSRTKEVGQAALNSISDKIIKNKLDNRTLSIYENMYNYRFDKNGRAINMNPIFQPNIPNVLPVYDKSGNIVGYQQNTTLPPIGTTTNTTTQRYGGKTPSSRNRDLVRAMKGL